MDALLRRRTMIASGGGLPYDLAEYIETAGGAYLDTGVCETSRNLEITLRMAWKGNDQSLFETFLGYMASGSTTPRGGIHKFQGEWMFGTNVTQKSSVSADSNIHTFFLTGNSSQNIERFFIDGVEITSATTASTGIAGNSIPYYLGCRNRVNSIDNLCLARFYALNIKFFNEPSHATINREYNFIPVRYNGVFQMFETINRTYHPSTSGTNFTGQLTV